MEAGVAPRPDVSPAVAPPPGNPRFELFDSLRAIAVLAVVVFHVASLTGDLNRRGLGDVLGLLGTQGLVIFFLISGFLLYRPYAAAHRAGRGRPDTRTYLRRRVLRIVPAYWAALTLLAIYPAINGVFSAHWWRYYLFLQDYSSGTVISGIPVAWTLSVEATFYVLLPVWAIAVRALSGRLGRRSWLAAEVPMLLCLAALGVAIQLAKSRLAVSSLIDTTLLGESVWFALGMALAVASVAFDGGEPISRFVARHPGVCWLGSAAALLGAAAVLKARSVNIALSLTTVQPVAKTLAGIVLTGAVAVLLAAPAVFGDHAGGWPRRVLGWRPLMLLGLVSYGVYLYHLTVAELIALPSDPGHFSASGVGLVDHVHHFATLVLLAAVLVVTVALATASYRIVELPFLRLKEPARRSG